MKPLFGELAARLNLVERSAPAPAAARLTTFLRQQLASFELPLSAVVALSAVIAVLEVRLFGLLGSLVDALSGASAGAATATLGWMLAVILVLPVLVYANSHVINQVLKPQLPALVRWRAHRWLLTQSLAFYQHEFAGRLAGKVNQCADAVRDIALKMANVLVYVGVYFLSIALLTAALDWRLAVPLLLWLLAYACLLRYFLPRLKRAAALHADAASDFSGCLVDAYGNIGTVKLFAHAGGEEAYARASLGRFVARAQPQMRLLTAMSASLVALNSLLTAAVVGLAFWLWGDGIISAGAIAAAVAAVLRIISFAEWILWEVGALSENIGVVRDAVDTLARPASVVDAPGAKPLPTPRGAIEFERVAFGYSATAPVFEDFSLTIAAGEKLGLVGRSGAGKTTLLQLLLRLYEPSAGRITIDGIDLAGCTQASVRAAVAVVTQDTALLHRSVRDNLRYARPDATDAELQAALRAAGAEQFVAQLSDSHGGLGLDAQVGERGASLSGGQRQRLAIARALLKDAPILLLDEATSALDSEVEAQIQTGLQQAMAGRTVLAIAHRLSTLQQMDRIVVLDHGRVVEQGSHAELLARGGLYAQLWQLQMQAEVALSADSPDASPAR